MIYIRWLTLSLNAIDFLLTQIINAGNGTRWKVTCKAAWTLGNSYGETDKNEKNHQIVQATKMQFRCSRLTEMINWMDCESCSILLKVIFDIKIKPHVQSESDPNWDIIMKKISCSHPDCWTHQQKTQETFVEWSLGMALSEWLHCQDAEPYEADHNQLHP